MMTIINFEKVRAFSKLIWKSLVFAILFLLLVSCSEKETFTANTIKTPSGWGYTISYKDKVFIRQTIIPAISHNKTFCSENDALKVAGLVIKKLRQNRCPSVTKNDLILLKIKL